MYSIHDNGIGIPKEHYDKIFQLFFRLDPKHSTGEGLGLTVVKKNIQRLKGRIGLESNPEAGTTFNVYLKHTREKE